MGRGAVDEPRALAERASITNEAEAQSRALTLALALTQPHLEFSSSGSLLDLREERSSTLGAASACLGRGSRLRVRARVRVSG